VTGRSEVGSNLTNFLFFDLPKSDKLQGMGIDLQSIPADVSYFTLKGVS